MPCPSTVNLAGDLLLTNHTPRNPNKYYITVPGPAARAAAPLAAALAGC